mmetsp:Transcript_3964/g.7652  ORF Transcript_3964/g.7652 Transcript_3964/m.7652 type:complete len:109 (-) Transcript_3964:1292-1618(-)
MYWSSQSALSSDIFLHIGHRTVVDSQPRRVMEKGRRFRSSLMIWGIVRPTIISRNSLLRPSVPDPSIGTSCRVFELLGDIASLSTLVSDRTGSFSIQANRLASPPHSL